MAILQVRGVDDRLYNALKQKAQIENRSITQEVISILGKYLSNPNPNYYNINLTREFLNLSWEDTRDAKEIVKDIVKDRINKKSFGEFNGIFN
ncbi:MAG: antitoxin [Treponema sp.]|jgi:plasmid stability protein|nr:antitoxin [Treponema sp.]